MKPEFLSPVWTLPLQGLLEIAPRTLPGSTLTHPVYAEPWDGPTNTVLRQSLGGVLKRITNDRRLKNASAKMYAAIYVDLFLECTECDDTW